MEIRITGNPKEIAALVVAIQERQNDDYLLLAVEKNSSPSHLTQELTKNSDSSHLTQDGFEIKEC